MKYKKSYRLFYVLFIGCILFGIGSGVYFEFFDNTPAEDNTINWKKGFFRIAVIISSVVAIIIGGIFAILAKKGKLVDKNDDEEQQKISKNPKVAFLAFSLLIFALIWLIYFFIQWPIYYAVVFVIKGFKS